MLRIINEQINADTKNIPSNLNVDDSKLGVVVEKLEKNMSYQKKRYEIQFEQMHYRNSVTQSLKYQRGLGTGMKQVLTLQVAMA